MSDPFDARILRRMVHDLASEEMPAVDWDAAEERLLARLDAEGPVSTLDRRSSADAEAEVEIGDRISEVGLGDPALGDPNLENAVDPARREVARVTEALVAIESDRPSIPYVAAAGSGARVSKLPVVMAQVPRISMTPAEGLARVPRLRGERPRWFNIAAVAAVAACFAFVVGGFVARRGHEVSPGSQASNSASEQPEITAERLVDPADVPMAPGGSAHDLAALRAGDVIEASQGAVSFAGTMSVAGSSTIPDRTENISWTLAAGSRVLVRAGFEEPRHVLVLESGSIRAEIQGVSGSVDPFVIEAGDTAVAVGDTVFSVTRSSKGIVVDVEKGSVAVGSRLYGPLSSSRDAANDPGHPLKVLEAPSRGSFSLDGGRTFKALEPVVAAFQPPTRDTQAIVPPSVPGVPESGVSEKRPRDEARRVPAEVASAGPGPLSTVPADPVMTEASIRSSLGRCFASVEAQRKKDSKNDGVSLVMRSLLKLRVADDGAIKGAAFNPPLRSDLQGCAVGLLSARVDRGARTLEIPIEIHP